MSKQTNVRVRRVFICSQVELQRSKPNFETLPGMDVLRIGNYGMHYLFVLVARRVSWIER